MSLYYEIFARYKIKYVRRNFLSLNYEIFAHRERGEGERERGREQAGEALHGARGIFCNVVVQYFLDILKVGARAHAPPGGQRTETGRGERNDRHRYRHRHRHRQTERHR